MEALLKEFMNKIDARFDGFENKISKELVEIRNTMATKEELSEIRNTMATKEDVADLPLIKQAVLETRETVTNLEKSVDDLMNKNEEFARIQANHQKILDLLSIKSVELEAKTRWV